MSATAEAPLRLDVLIRTSQRKAEAKSPQQQEEVCRRSAALNGYEIAAVHDSGKSESGKTMARATIETVKERIRSGETNGVIVAWLDRLSRAPIEEAMTEIRGLTALGGKLVAADGNGQPIDLTDPMAETMLVIQLQFARQTWLSISQRFEMSRRNAIKEGKAVGGEKWGYKFKDPTPKDGGKGVLDSHLVVDERLKPIVKELFERKAAGHGMNDEQRKEAGATWLELARWLDQVDPKPDGKLWSRQAVIGIIRSRTYLGEVNHGKNRKAKAHEPLVSPSLWRRAQNEPGRMTPRGTDLLSGIARCAGCGRTMKGTKLGRGLQRIYACANRECSSRSTIMAARLDAEVAERLANITVEVPDPPAADGGALAEAHADVERLTIAVETLASIVPTHPSAVAAHQDALERAERELREAEVRVDALEAQRSPWSFDAFGRAWDAWKPMDAEGVDVDPYEGEMTLEELRGHLRQAVDCVLVRKSKGKGTNSDIPHRVLVLPKGTAPEPLTKKRGAVQGWAWEKDASTLQPVA